MQRPTLFSSSAVGFSVLKEEITPFVKNNEYAEQRGIPKANETILFQIKNGHTMENTSSFTNLRGLFHFCSVIKHKCFIAIMFLILLIAILISRAIYINYQPSNMDGTNASCIGGVDSDANRTKISENREGI